MWVKTKNQKGEWFWDGGAEGRAWLEDESGVIMVKVVYGTDPVEMTADQARELAAILSELADEADA